MKMRRKSIPEATIIGAYVLLRTDKRQCSSARLRKPVYYYYGFTTTGMAIHQIIYHSTATRELSEAELGRLVSQAQIYNYSESITGILFYDGGHFLQLLEGQQESLERLYACIMEDPRHTRVVTLFNGCAPKRLFSNWSMGVSQPTAAAMERLTGYLNPRRQAALLPKGYNAQEVNMDLLQECVAEYPVLVSRVAASGCNAGRLGPVATHQPPKGNSARLSQGPLR